MESCNRIKEENGRLAQGEDEVRKIWKEYFEDPYNIDTRYRENYFGGEATERAEVEVRVGKLKYGKAAGKDEIDHWINDKGWR